jgi:protocatechuate 3,4-dioxygenase beta subunit
MNPARRRFLSYTASGLAVCAAGELVLPASAAATPVSGTLGTYGLYLQQVGQKPNAQAKPAGNWAATEDNIEGPFFRAGAPYRAKITPPLAPGRVLLISGRVFGLDTRRPLANTVIDIWQANAQGRYTFEDEPKPNPQNPERFSYRARLLTDENGYYEFETIHPAPYQIGPNRWRPAHIHYWVRHTQYRELITQLYFRGDDHQKADPWIKESLIVNLTEQKTPNGNYKTGVFNIVLRPRGG